MYGLVKVETLLLRMTQVPGNKCQIRHMDKSDMKKINKQLLLLHTH